MIVFTHTLVLFFLLVTKLSITKIIMHLNSYFRQLGQCLYNELMLVIFFWSDLILYDQVLFWIVNSKLFKFILQQISIELLQYIITRVICVHIFGHHLSITNLLENSNYHVHSSIQKKKNIFAIKSTLWWCKLQSFWISKISGGCTFDRNTNSIEKFFNLSYALPCICNAMDELNFWQDFLIFIEKKFKGILKRSAVKWIPKINETEF